MKVWLPFGVGLAAALLAAAGARVNAGEAAARGTIEGHVRVTGPTPGNPFIRMGADPLCSRINTGTRVVQEFVVKSPDGGLANVFVSVKGTFPRTPPPAAPVVLDQQGCVYRPHVVGARVGQTLQIKNSDPTLHNVHSLSLRGNDFNMGQPASGMVFNIPLKKDEVMLHIKCDVHSWMNSYVGIVDNPYFAVSGDGGTFRIAGVPAGRQTVQAWHERFGPLAQTVNVRAGGTTRVEFTYTGAEKPAAPSSAGLEELLLPDSVAAVQIVAARR